MSPLAERIHSALPQTQCTRCGYPDCAAYAQAVAGGEALLNQCPPGGAEGIDRLAAITGRPALPLNPENGTEAPRKVAVIDEAVCIGCTLCIPVCPTDAIVGSNKLMHTVMEPYCTGCELCVAVCPMDCIALENVTGVRTGWNAWSQEQAALSLARYAFHQSRVRNDAGSSAVPADRRAPAGPAEGPAPAQGGASDEAARKRTLIEAALVRARASRTS